MKRIYWRPRGIPRATLVLLAVISALGMAAVENLKIESRQPNYSAKLKAAEIANEAFLVIKAERQKRRPAIDIETDPAQSGLVGVLMTPVTSDAGSLPAKQTSVNPNFAAAIVGMLKRANVQKGDVVAIGPSGSFPALNICTYAACKALELRPIIVSSASASQWGANLPDLLWIDMERILREKGVFPYKSVAASLGGIEDRAIGTTDAGRAALLKAIQRNEIPLIDAEDFKGSIDRRMEIFRQAAGEQRIAAYINIGGGAVSTGTQVGKRLFQPGLTTGRDADAAIVDSVMSRFMDSGVPIIHLTQIEQLARQFGLPTAPQITPRPGQGGVFVRKQYNRWLAAGVLVMVLVSLYAFVRSNVGQRLLKSSGGKKDDAFSVEPMV